MTDLEIRASGGEIRSVNEGDRTFELRVVSYGTVDSYGSVWEPGVFSDSLRTKMPSACWAHDWTRVIGSLKEHDERSDGLYGLVKLADFEHVPDARMAWSLIKDGHVKDTSFGFKRSAWADARNDDTYKPTIDGEKERIRVARLDEVSPVLVGAVPGAGVLSVRSDDRVSVRSAGDLLAALAVGRLTLREALNALEGGQPEPQEREDAEVELRTEDVDTAIDLMRYDGLVSEDFLRKAGVGIGNEAKLKEYWSHGKGAAKIRWGTEGDHTRCVRELSKYVGPGVVHGLCTNIQKLAIGHAGNITPAEKGL